jgi:hypothetical protein
MVASRPELPGAAGCVRISPGGEFLQIGDDAGKIGGVDHRMEVVLHDDPRVELEPFLSLAEAKGAGENVAAGLGS